MDASDFLKKVDQTWSSGRRIENCNRSPGWHAKKYGCNPQSNATNADHCHCGKKLTLAHVKVAAKLAYYRSDDPKHRLLARAARCSTGTVVRALERLRLLSLLSWDRQFLVTSGRAWRASNRYALGLSKVSNNLVFPSSSNVIPRRFLLTGKPGESPESRPAQNSLAQIAAAAEARLAAQWAEKRRPPVS